MDSGSWDCCMPRHSEPIWSESLHVVEEPMKRRTGAAASQSMAAAERNCLISLDFAGIRDVTHSVGLKSRVALL